MKPGLPKASPGRTATFVFNKMSSHSSLAVSPDFKIDVTFEKHRMLHWGSTHGRTLEIEP